MELNEYHTKQILKDTGLPILSGKIAYTPAQIRQAYEDIHATRVWLKPQIMSPTPIYTAEDLSAKYLAESATEAEEKSNLIFGTELMNKHQLSKTSIQRIFVEEAVDIIPFCKLCIRVDFESLGITFSISNSVGKILNLALNDFTLTKAQEKQICSHLSIRNLVLKKSLMSVVKKTFLVFSKYEAMAIELNPMVCIKNHLYIVNARLVFDPDNLFKFPQLENLREIKLGHEREALAKKNGFRYTTLCGNIACISNGIGLGWATLDLLKQKGGSPACLLDLGTKPNEKSIATALRLAMSEPNVDGILINIFGGTTSCITIARGILDAASEISAGLPIVIRMVGLDQKDGEKMLNKSVVPFVLNDQIHTAVLKIVNMVKGVE